MFDARKEYTHQAILDAYCHMLSENIQPNILDLAKRAKIGRRTFYAYYKDIHAVHEELLRYLIIAYDLSDKDSRRNPMRMAISFLDYLHALPEKLQIVLKGNSSLYLELIDKVVLSHQNPLVLSSLYHLALGIYRQWLIDGNADYDLLRDAAGDLISIGYRGYARKRPARKAAGKASAPKPIGMESPGEATDASAQAETSMPYIQTRN